MIEAWVDGSYRETGGNRICGWAFVVVTDGEIEFEDYGNDVPEEYMEHRNVAGEIFAVKNLLEFCLENEESRVCIHYDYEGLEKWATGQWKTNKPLTKIYKEFVKETNLDIKWEKVTGHSGEKWNEYVDSLAKMAVGMDVAEKEITEPESVSEQVAENNENSLSCNEILAESEKLAKENKFLEASLCLKPFIKDKEEKIVAKYIEITCKLGEYYAKECVNICEAYLKDHPKSPVLKFYCYALYEAYCLPAFGKDDFDSYMNAKKAIKKILSVSRHEKIINCFLYPFCEYACRIGDTAFIKSIPSVCDVNIFSKEKKNFGGKEFPSKYDRIVLMLKNTVK